MPFWLPLIGIGPRCEVSRRILPSKIAVFVIDLQCASGAVEAQVHQTQGINQEQGVPAGILIGVCIEEKTQWIRTHKPAPDRIMVPRPVDRPDAIRRSRGARPNAVAEFGRKGTCG